MASSLHPTNDEAGPRPDPQRDRSTSDRPRRRRRAIVRRLWAYPLVYLALCLALFSFQRSLLYPRHSGSVSLPEAFQGVIDEVELRTSDDLRLHAWYRPGARPGTVIIFHGNGGHRGHRLEWFDLIHSQGYGVFLLDYRGYGGSDGTPTEEGLYRDGEAALDWVREHAPGPVVLLGESLGSGVAVELATRHDIAGLVIHAGYSSIPDVASKHLRVFPVGLLSRDRYESERKIAAVTCPKLFIHGREDRTIHYRVGERLYIAAPHPKEWVGIEGAGHDDLAFHDPARYFGELRSFLVGVLDR